MSQRINKWLLATTSQATGIVSLSETSFHNQPNSIAFCYDLKRTIISLYQKMQENLPAQAQNALKPTQARTRTTRQSHNVNKNLFCLFPFLGFGEDLRTCFCVYSSNKQRTKRCSVVVLNRRCCVCALSGLLRSRCWWMTTNGSGTCWYACAFVCVCHKCLLVRPGIHLFALRICCNPFVLGGDFYIYLYVYRCSFRLPLFSVFLFSDFFVDFSLKLFLFDFTLSKVISLGFKIKMNWHFIHAAHVVVTLRNVESWVKIEEGETEILHQCVL